MNRTTLVESDSVTDEAPAISLLRSTSAFADAATPWCHLHNNVSADTTLRSGPSASDSDVESSTGMAQQARRRAGGRAPLDVAEDLSGGEPT